MFNRKILGCSNPTILGISLADPWFQMDSNQKQESQVCCIQFLLLIFLANANCQPYSKKPHHHSGLVVESLHLSHQSSPGEDCEDLHFAGALQKPSSLRASMSCRDLSWTFSLEL